jgi:soluble lytic murein transglycosylase-like protein
MRRFIPFIGMLMVILAGAKQTNIGPAPVVLKTSLADAAHDEKARILDWMGRTSTVPAGILEQIYEEAHKHDFPDLLLAIAKVESDFDPAAISHAGATGLTQVMAHVWEKELREKGVISGADDLFDVSRCMAASAYILGKYLAWEGGDLRGALMRYGGTRADTGYQDKVIGTLAEIRGMKYQTSRHGT